MKKRFLTAMVSLAAALAFFLPAPSQTATVSAGASSDFPCNYAAQGKGGEYVYYGSSAVNTYTAAEAAAAGIPEGYEDSVVEILYLDKASSLGMLVDFSAEKIPQGLIEGITFRVYVGKSEKNTGIYPQLRIPKPDELGTNWVWQPKDAATPVEQWTDVTVPATQSNFSTLMKDGYLHKFELALRSNAQVSFYVDKITVNLKANDGVAPVITYDGADTIHLSANAAVEVPATAYDAQEQREIAVEKAWEGESPVQGDGTLKNGTYTLILRATDYYGNVSEKRITVVVVEADTEAPVIHLNVTQITATTGTIPLLSATATDNSGNVEVTYAWSDGALDEKGGLTKGLHSWTVTAKDSAGNITTKTVTFIVADEEDLGDNVIDEETAFLKHFVTFNGENAQEYAHNAKVEKPADPVKASTEKYVYTFDGWYNGDVKWNFDTDMVVSDVDLVAKFIASKRTYTVTFNGANGVQYEYGALIEKPADPTEAGKEFLGWYKGGMQWKFDEYTVMGDMDLVAKWEEPEAPVAEEKGCGSVLGISSVGAMLLGIALCLKTKNRE